MFYKQMLKCSKVTIVPNANLIFFTMSYYFVAPRINNKVPCKITK